MELNFKNVYEEVSYAGQPLISTGWVCTEKMKGGKLVCKARLVARGFEEDSSSLKIESPTCSKDSFRIMLTVVCSMKWKIHSIDIKSAFLQGMPLSRSVFLKPPKEAETESVWKLKQAVYGLNDASRHWYERVFEELVNSGMTVSKLDAAVFYFHQGTELHGIFLCHVDDFLLAGTSYFNEKVVQKIHSVFIVGVEEVSIMDYLGLNLQQVESSIRLSMSKYINSIDDIVLCPSRRTLKEDNLLPGEYETFRHAVGQLNWCVTQVRVDAAFENCSLANACASPTIRDLLFAQKTVKKIKGEELHLLFSGLSDLYSLTLLCYSDASFGNLPSGASQGAYLIFVSDLHGNANLISWQSRKLKRVCNSTLSAECLAAVDAVNAAFLFREMILEIVRKSKVRIRLITDNKSLMENASSITLLEDKRLRIEMAILRESLQNHDIEKIVWIASRDNLANSLTKQGASTRYLVDVIMNDLKFDYDKNLFTY